MENKYIDKLAALSVAQIDFDLCDANRYKSIPSIFTLEGVSGIYYNYNEEIIQSNPQKSALPRPPRDPEHFFRFVNPCLYFLGEANKKTIPEIVHNLGVGGYSRFILTTNEGHIHNGERTQSIPRAITIDPLILKENNGLKRFYHGVNWETFRGLSSEDAKRRFLAQAGFEGVYDIALKVAEHQGRESVLLEDIFSDKANDSIYAIQDDNQVILRLLVGPVDNGIPFSFKGNARSLASLFIGTDNHDLDALNRKARRVIFRK